MKRLFCLIAAFVAIIICPCPAVHAQGGVAINTAGALPDNSALLDVSSSSKGLLLPRMSTTERDAITNPAAGLVIYNTDCSVFNFNAGTPSNPNWATLNSSNVLAAGVSISATPAGAICAGTSVTFSAIPSQNNLSPTYQWQVNGANVGTNSTTYTTSNLNNGDVVTCILSSSAPCVTGSPATSNPITMLVNIVPAITGTTSTGFCSGSAVTLSASADLGTINWYNSAAGGSSLSTGASFTVSGLTSTTTYYVDATANGCTTPIRTAVTATFYPSSPGQPGAISGPIVVDRDSTITYSVSALPNTASYAWAVTLGTITSGQGSNTVSITWGDSLGIGSVSVAAVNTCGTGPSQSLQVGVETFSYTGSAQTFTVPTGVSSVTITAYGAQGGNSGGLGGMARGTLSVNAGDVLYVYVGGQSTWNGGGVGSNSGGNGGDESDVRMGGTSINNWVIVAGGGGGSASGGGGAGGGGASCANGAGGAGGAPAYAPYSSAGGDGTCTNGGAGGSSSSGWSGGGGGGGLTSGGTGSGGGGYANTGGTGTQGIGGARGVNINYSCNTGAGGGGGYYGGGGSSDAQCSPGGGGGGSSWASGAMTNLTFTGGVQSGNGKVVISW